MGCVQNWDATAASNVERGKQRTSLSPTLGHEASYLQEKKCEFWRDSHKEPTERFQAEH